MKTSRFLLTALDYFKTRFASQDKKQFADDDFRIVLKSDHFNLKLKYCKLFFVLFHKFFSIENMQFDSFTKKTMHEVRCDIIESHLTTTMNYDEETLIELIKLSDYFVCKPLKHLYLEIFIKTKRISTLDKLRYLDTVDVYFFNQTLDFSLRNMFLMFFLRQSIVNSQEYEKLFGFLEIGK